MTRDELDSSNATNITGAGKVTKSRHSTHNNNIADYIDGQSYTGKATRSGSGVPNFSVSHPLMAPYSVQITPASVDAMAPFYVSGDATGLFTITFETPPPTDTNNVIFYWTIKQIPS